MNNQEILDNAPEGATHVDEENDYFAFNARWRWNLWHDETKRFEATRATPTRSLADIKRIAELEEIKKEYEETLLKLPIRDLEQQAKGAVNGYVSACKWALGSQYDECVAKNRALIYANQLKEQDDE